MHRLRIALQPLSRRCNPLYDEAGNVIDGHKHKGDFNSERYRVKTKNRHAVKHDGLMFRLVDQL
jgi:hypothetical protein